MSAFAAAVGALFADPNIGQDAVYIAVGGAPVLVRVVRIGTLDPVELGRIGNPFEGAATAAGAAAADAFSAALARTYLEPPDLGLGALADDARARADGYREAAGMLADAAGRPLASWHALKDAVTGTGTEAETALADAANSADALTAGLNDTAAAADGHEGAVL